MGDFLDYFKNKKNLANILILGILILALPLGINLIRQQQILKSRAAADPIVFTQNAVLKNGQWFVVDRTKPISLEVTSPLGPPPPVPAASPTPPPVTPPPVTPPPVTPPPVTPPPPPVTPPPAAVTPQPRVTTGPCAGRSPCVFDSRTMFYNPDGSRTESITAYGKYWNWNSPSAGVFNPDGNNGSDLTSVSRYASGPCAGRSPCVFDSRTMFYNPDGSRTESITAYGRYWNWNSPSAGVFNADPANGSELSSVSRYASGPCSGRSYCTFDSRTMFYNPDGSRTESITAYGRYWNWNSPSAGVFNADPANGSELSSVSRYASGPCVGISPCVFDSRTMFYNPDGSRTESITAYGKYWNWNSPSAGVFNPDGNNGSDLSSVVRYGGTPAGGPSPVPVTVASATLNGQSLDLTGGTALSTTLALPSGATFVDVPVIINLSTGSPRNLIIRFNYQPQAPPALTGICGDKAPGTCVFDSRTMFYNPDGSRTESITAYGKYWNWNSPSAGVFNPDGNNGSDLTSVSRYASGPCAGRSPCVFDSRTMFYNPDGSRTESITAYGKYWNWNSPSAGVFNPDGNNGSDLTSVSRYASGPCAGRSPCVFDSRTMFYNPDGSRTESITAYGKYWNFNSANNWAPMSGNGNDLTSVPWYASGPCSGRSYCTFDSRTMFYNPDGSRTESITAYGKYWNWNSPSAGVFNPDGNNGSDLSSVGRYSQ